MSKYNISKPKGRKLWKLVYPLVLLFMLLSLTLPAAIPVSASLPGDYFYDSTSDGYISVASTTYADAQSAGTGNVNDGSDTITIGQTVPTNTTQSQTIPDSGYSMSGEGNERCGKRVDGFSGTISEVQFMLSKQTSPIGTGYCVVRSVSDDSILGTIGSVDVADLTTWDYNLGHLGDWVTFDTNPITISTPTDIRICFEYTGSSEFGNVVFAMGTSNTPTIWGAFTYYYYDSGEYSWSDENYTDAVFKITYTTLYEVNRGFLFFDTSGIPDDATIGSASLGFYGATDTSDNDFFINIVSGSNNPSDPLSGTDFALNQYSGSAGALDTSTFNSSGYNSIDFDPEYLVWINKTGDTRLGLFSNNDISGTEPSGNEYVTIFSAEYESGNYTPELQVTYDLSGTTYVITLGVNPSEGGAIKYQINGSDEQYPTGSTIDVTYGDSVTLIAYPNYIPNGVQYRFDGWTEDGSFVYGSASYTFTADSNRNITADFIAQYIVYVEAVNSSTGSFDINDNPVSGTGESVKFDAGTNITITPVPADNYAFTYWMAGAASTFYSTEPTITINDLSDNYSFTGRFDPTYTITTSAGEGGSIDPAGPVTVSVQVDSSTQSLSYPDQTFTIKPNSDYHIAAVLIDGTPTTWDEDNNVTISGADLFPTPGDNITLTAAFEANPVTYTVTYNGNGSTSGSVPIDNNQYSPGATVTVQGNTGNLQKTGYVFAGWTMTSDGSGTIYNAPNTFTVNNNVTLYAKWKYNTTTSLTGTKSARALQKVTFTANVSADISRKVTPDGTVTFWDGSTLLGTVNLIRGKATLTITTLLQGPHTIHAEYSGDSKCDISTSNTLTVNIK